MKYRLLFLNILFLFRLLYLNADTIPQKYFGLQSHYGFIIPHSSEIEQVSHTNPFGFGLSRNKLRISYKDWQVFNAYWISGIEIRYFNFRNPQVLGDVYDLTVFAEPVVSYGKKYFLTVRGGAGFSYHRLVYDPVDNPLNLFFSTKISFPLYISARFKYKVGNQTFLNLSGYYNHISNGGFKQPNKGMNFPTMAVGVEYFQKPLPVMGRYLSSDRITRGSGMSLTIQFLSSIKVLGETENYTEKPAFIYGFHSRLTKPLGKKYALNAGAEMIFDGYIRETIRREDQNLDYKRFALTFGQDFMLGKIIFTQYLGIYLYSPYKARNSIYQKYELSYRVHRNMMIGVYQKAHLHVAELMGISLNYQLPWM